MFDSFKTEHLVDAHPGTNVVAAVYAQDPGVLRLKPPCVPPSWVGSFGIWLSDLKVFQRALH